MANRLRNAGIKRKRAAKTVVLTDEHKAKRVIFCQALLEHLDESDFQHFIFSDEKVYTTDPNHQKFVWRKKGDRRNRACLSNYRFSGRLTQSTWAAIGINGPVTPLIRTGRFNARKYRIVLEKCLVPILNYKNIYIQDNSRIHAAGMIQEYLEQQSFTTLPWPPNSPDLNLIENLWAATTRDWKHMDRRNISSLNERIDEKWNACEQDKRKYSLFLYTYMSYIFHTNCNGERA